MHSRPPEIFCYGDEENARISAALYTTARI